MYFNTRRNEIDLLLTSGNIAEAIKRALDFLEDFSDNPADLPQMVALSSRYYQLSKQGPVSFDNKHEFAGIITEMLEQVTTSLGENPPGTTTAHREVLILKNIHKSFKSSNFELNNISVTLHSGEITGVIGPNANGKSTLLKIIVGDLQKDNGDIRFPAFETRQSFPGWAEIKRQTAYIPQELIPWKGALKEVLSYEAARHGILGEACDLRTDFIIHRLGLSDYINLDWNQLSGGYKLRFELARALVWKPTFVVLDEPLANLDAAAQLTILNDLRNLAHSYKNPISVLVTSQHIHEIEHIADNLLVLETGKVIYAGQPFEFNRNNAYKIAELSCNTSFEKVKNALQIPHIQLDDRGYCVLVKIPASNDPALILQLLLANNIRVEYFRDITHSVKQIFYDVD